MTLLGAVILVIAAYGCGIAIASEEGEKLKALEGLIGLLQYFRRRMVAEGTPLYLLFDGYKNEYLERSGFLPRLRSFGNRAPRFWGEALEALSLEETAKDELLHFGESLGRLELEGQLKNIDSCLSVLVQERERLKKTIPMKQKSIKAAAFLSGALTAIVLI